MTKEEFMTNENWGPCDGSTTRTRGNGDVKIRLVEGGYSKAGKRKSISFRFYDGAEKKIGNSGYGNFRVFEKKVYFREEQVGSGYKFCRYSGKGDSCEMKASIKDTNRWERFVGCYNLLYDRTLELYYIELDKKR